METPHGLRKFRAMLAWYLSRLQILTGIVTLGAASAIFSLSRRGRYDQNRNVALQVFPMLFVVIGLLFFMSHQKRRTNH